MTAPMLLRSVGIRVVLSYGTYAKEIRRNKRRDSCAISCSESHSLHRTKRGDHRGVPNENLNLLTNPRDDWGAIVNEATDITSVYRHSRRDTLQAVKLVGF